MNTEDRWEFLRELLGIFNFPSAQARGPGSPIE